MRRSAVSVSVLLIVAILVCSYTAFADAYSEVATIRVYDVTPSTFYPITGTVSPPISISIVEYANASSYDTGIVVSSVVEETNVTIVFVPLVAASLIVPTTVTTCYSNVTITVYAIHIVTGEPIYNLTIGYEVVETGDSGWSRTDPYGRAIIRVSLPERGVYHLVYYIEGLPVASTTINYIVCFGTGPGVPPGVGGAFNIGIGTANVSTVVVPVGVGELNASFVLASRPRLDTPTGIIVAVMLASLWAWLAKKAGVAYATVVTGFVLAAIGAAFYSEALTVAGAVLMAGGVVLRSLGLTS